MELPRPDPVALVDRALLRVALMTPRAWARLAARLALMDEGWVRARCPGLVEKLGPDWRGELLALAARLRRR
jgi:hypothetical protein